MKAWKISGAGNTFLIEILGSEKMGPSKNEVRKLCESYQVDGYLGLEKINSEPLHFQWHFFNRDGSEAEFCGNAARCAQFFISSQVGLQNVTHQTKAGTVTTWHEDGSNWVKMPQVQVFKEKTTLLVNSNPIEGFWCDTGVPHFVVLSKVENPDKRISEALRIHPDLGPRGANVTWIFNKDIQSQIASAVTFERGVEDFTQACGTGALAAALYLHTKQPDKNEFQIRMPGGVLQLRKLNSDWLMTGPVEKIDEWQGSET